MTQGNLKKPRGDSIKAQYSVEFMLIFAFSLVVIIPVVYLMNEQYQNSKQDLDISQARIVLDEITVASQKTFYAGYPSRTTLELFFPYGISSITTYNVSSTSTMTALVFNVSVGSQISSISTVLPFTINSSISSNQGKRKIVIKAEKDDRINITEYTG